MISPPEFHYKFQSNWSRNGWVMAKNWMHIYGIIGIMSAILAHNLAKNTITLHILSNFQHHIILNEVFMTKKAQKT